MSYIQIFVQSHLLYYGEIILRLLLALALGGIIGFEREAFHKPAGFRTHMLVCVGAALVMITSEFIFERYSSQTTADPARLGAQIISGIGFLGAGTIIREGFSVKGLTTAASLWTVSCVGIAVGIGFYEGAIIAAILIFITLLLMKRMQKFIFTKKMNIFFYIHAEYLPDEIKKLKEIFRRYDIMVKNTRFIDEEEKNTVVKFLVIIPNGLRKETFVEEVTDLMGIRKIYEC